MANSPQKRKADSALDDPTTVSRSGRIRKPKVFYDPSEVVAKRRSVPIIETSKSKKTTKLPEPELIPSPPPLNTSAQPELVEIKKPLDMKPPAKKVSVVEKSKPKAASIGNSRRKTVCVASVYDDGGNGCIVCNRSDVKKGRFVNCIDCIKRGHFTCLRTEKLFKTADQEGNWQCPSCKICEFCNMSKPSEQLYKCVICLNSYHLDCTNKIVPITKSVVKKKFTCGFCLKGASVHTKSIDPPRPMLPNRKSEGFPGFGHFETMKPKDPAKIYKKAISFPKSQQPTSTKSSPGSYSNDARLTAANVFDVKIEKKSPTPEQSSCDSPPPMMHAFVQQMLANAPSTNKTISVRTDLVQPTGSHRSATSTADEIKPENGDAQMMDITYDSKTVITPHESIPDVRKWDIDEVYTYFLGKDKPEFAQILKDHQIDGDALLLIKREDVLDRFNLKLGAALRLYAHIVSIQYKNNNPILAWNEF